MCTKFLSENDWLVKTIFQFVSESCLANIPIAKKWGYSPSQFGAISSACNKYINGFVWLNFVVVVSPGPVSISDKTSYRKILRCLEAAILVVWIIAGAAEVPVKFQSNRTILNTNIAASRLTRSYEILQLDVWMDIETGDRSHWMPMIFLLYPSIQVTLKDEEAQVSWVE